MLGQTDISFQVWALSVSGGFFNCKSLSGSYWYLYTLLGAAEGCFTTQGDTEGQPMSLSFEKLQTNLVYPRFSLL